MLSLLEVKKQHKDTPFIRGLEWIFGKVCDIVCRHSWSILIVATLISGFCLLRIPLTPIHDSISDYTPLDAPSFRELKAPQTFYGDGLTPHSFYAFISPKNGDTMFTMDRIKAALEVHDTVIKRFTLRNAEGRDVSYSKFCRAFCLFNEPLRVLYNAMQLASNTSAASERFTVQQSSAISTFSDVGYPDSLAFGVRVHLDPYLFGVQIAVKGKNGHEEVVPVRSVVKELSNGVQVPNNIRDVKLIVMSFKSELSTAIPEADIITFEKSVLEYFTNVFNSDIIEVEIIAESFITNELSRLATLALPFLILGCMNTIAFSTVTFILSALAIRQMSMRRIYLAVMTCICPLMACAVGMGGMFYLGVRFGTILCVTPFLLLAIGADDAYLMVNAWQHITHERRSMGMCLPEQRAELLYRMRAMMVETGPSITITTLTNVMAFLISSYGSSPDIQLFSVGNAICLAIAFVYQLTVFTSLMAILGKHEIEEEYNALMVTTKSKMELNETGWSHLEEKLGAVANLIALKAKRALSLYCRLLTKSRFAWFIMFLYGVYLYMAITGTLSVRAELKPEQILRENSSIGKVYEKREKFISPSYTVSWVYVQNPGDDVWANEDRIKELVEAFESLPSSVGRYSTKFFLREFEEWERKENKDYAAEFNGTATAVEISRLRNEALQEFLSYPHFSYWTGFLRIEKDVNDESGPSKIARISFSTAVQGDHLNDWSERLRVLKEQRAIADDFSDLDVLVYQEDARFLDVIDTQVPQTLQTALFTLISMFFVTILFIPTPLVLLTATSTIISTTLGVFGIMMWKGAVLDPILMACAVMSIGFSVDIPAHIAYHYHETASLYSSVSDRLEHTISRVGFPIMQASISTILCVVSLFGAHIHMFSNFATVMILVVSIGTVHGLIVMPVIFALLTPLLDRLCVRDPQGKLSVVAVPIHHGLIMEDDFEKEEKPMTFPTTVLIPSYIDRL